MALNQVSVVEDSFCQHSSILSSRNTQPEARKATKLGYLQNFFTTALQELPEALRTL